MGKEEAQKKTNVFKSVTAIAIAGIAVASVVGFIFYNTEQGNKRQEQERLETEAEAEVRAKVEREVIYDNIFINDVDVGGMAKDEAMKKMDSLIGEPAAAKKITVVKGDESYPFTFQELGFQYALKEAVETAWNYARDGEDKERYDEIAKLDGQPYKITAEYNFDEKLVKEKISILGQKFYIEPVNAAMAKKGNAFHVTEGKSGEKLNEAAMAEIFLQKLADNVEGDVDAIMEEVAPEFTVASLTNAQSLIGSYNTSFTAGENGRNTNIRNACDKINGIVIYPGEIFSTNAAFGVMTYDNGYRPAPVIVNGKLEDDLGGGVCQVSSTLYMALLHAELEITERRNHSLKVAYLPFAYDATLAGNYIDLKFRNNLDVPVYLEAMIKDGNAVLVNVYGKEIHSPNRKLVFQNSLVETIAPPMEEIIHDSSMPLGQQLVSAAAKTGYKYNLYKIVYEADKEVERVLVNTSTYRAVRGQVRVGTGPADAVADASAAQDAEPPQEVEAPAGAHPDPVEVISQPSAIADPEPESAGASEQPGRTEQEEVTDATDGPLMPE